MRGNNQLVDACHVYPYETGDGPANMALDEAMLDAASRGEAGPALRMYGWSVATLSLGYFQRIAEVRADARWRDVPIVRRLTGGGAIWHDHELTFALVLPETHKLSRLSERLYRAVHGAIADGLVELGIGAVRFGEVFSAGDCGRSRPLLCFTDRSAEDLVCGGTKIVGSAQRRRRGAVLLHGSLLLARSKQTPELAGLSDVAPGTADPGEWSGSVAEWITTGVGMRGIASSIPKAIREQAEARAAERYRNAAWTEFR